MLDREWTDTTDIEVMFPMRPRTTRRYNNALALERGPLLYALKIGEDWKRVNEDKPHRELPHADWEVYPTTPWKAKQPDSGSAPTPVARRSPR